MGRNLRVDMATLWRVLIDWLTEFAMAVH